MNMDTFSAKYSYYTLHHRNMNTYSIEYYKSGYLHYTILLPYCTPYEYGYILQNTILWIHSLHHTPTVLYTKELRIQPIAFGVSFLHSQISIDDLVL